MPIKPAGKRSVQTGILSSTDAADRTIMLRPNKGVSFMLDLTAGSPATGAKLEVTTDTHAAIAAGTATWTTVTGSSNTLVDQTLTSTGPSGCQLTGVRALVTDGTWSLKVVQA